MVYIFIEANNKRVHESSFLQAILDSLSVDPQTYDIRHTDGNTNLLNPKMTHITDMRANSDIGGKNLVIFDADSESNYGGFNNRKAELLSGKEQFDLDFELFLWPDNHSDGDVEELIESIARKDLYPEFFDCFEKYEKCMSKRKNERGNPFYSVPDRKGKLHTFFHAIPISKTKKDRFGNGDWLWDDVNIWDMNSASLNPIKEFLSKHLL